MPDTPTPVVKGQELPEHGARSISSLAPAATISGFDALTATLGSFCLFRGKGVGGLPTLTSVSPVAAEAGIARMGIARATRARMRRTLVRRCIITVPLRIGIDPDRP